MNMTEHTSENTVPPSGEGDFPGSDLRLLRLFRRCAHLQHRHRGGLPGQRRVLILLLQRGGMTQRELLELMDIRSASLSELLEKMEHSGFLIRSPSLKDKRVADVRLTAHGERTAREALRERAERARALFEDLRTEERIFLDETLTRLLNRWRDLDGPDTARTSPHAPDAGTARAKAGPLTARADASPPPSGKPATPKAAAPSDAGFMLKETPPSHAAFPPGGKSCD